MTAWILTAAARTLVALLQAPPLRVVALLGRAGGQIAWWLDRRHRRVALANLARAFPDLRPHEVRALASENFRRLGENYASGVKTASLSPQELAPHVECVGLERLLAELAPPAASGGVCAIGHFGNFELYARVGQFVPGLRTATTYRGLHHPALNRVLQSLRERSGCLFFERRKDAAALKQAMSVPGLWLGLLADQHAGDKGLRLPFLGRDCSTSAAPALFALRYRYPLYSAICYRVALARWRIEFGPAIPTHLPDGQPRPVEAIMSDVNRAYEAAIRRDPANWFWVHQRWKPAPHRAASAPAEPAALNP